MGDMLGTNVRQWMEPQYREAFAADTSYEELLGKPGLMGTEVWDEAKKAKPDLSEGASKGERIQSVPGGDTNLEARSWDSGEWAV